MLCAKWEGDGVPISDERGWMGHVQGGADRGSIQHMIRVVLHQMEVVGVL